MEGGLSGREFMREVGADPAQWAAKFLDAYAVADAVCTHADRLEFVTQWFTDAMRAAQQAMPKPILEE